METKVSPPAKQRTNTKSVVVVVLIGLCLLVCCALGITFAWYGGYIKTAVCSSVTTDSAIYSQMECSKTAAKENVSDTQSDYPLNSSSSNTNSVQGGENDDNTVANIVSKDGGAVVGIGEYVENSTAQDLKDNIIGTGFLISDAGLLVTNLHVVESTSTTYYVLFKGAESALVIENDNIYRDSVNDIALIKIDKSSIPSGVTAISVGDSDKIQIGETVIAIGNPLGTLTGTVTKGIISGLNREVTVSQNYFNTTSNRVYQNVIQTDAAINPGNSGGPLINSAGEVIGINFATVEDASNLSFALPINLVKQRISELEQYGKFRIPYLGVEYNTNVLFLNKQMVVGAQIVSVVDGSPAAAAGLKAGDVIISFNGSNLNSSQLSSLIQSCTVGQKVDIVIIRSQQQMTVTATIGVN